MDELVKMVAKKTGLTQAQARAAAQAVVGFLKEKLPAPIAAQIDVVLENPGIGNALGSMRSTFGKK